MFLHSRIRFVIALYLITLVICYFSQIFIFCGLGTSQNTSAANLLTIYRQTDVFWSFIFLKTCEL